MTERLQSFFHEGRLVMRTAIGADAKLPAAKQTPAPKEICEAVSTRYAQRIAAALNVYIPSNERRAMQRQAVTETSADRLAALKSAFKSVLGRDND